MPTTRLIDANVTSLIADDNVLNPDKPVLSSALALYLQHNLDVASTLLADRSLAHDDLDIVSFDRGPDRVPACSDTSQPE